MRTRSLVLLLLLYSALAWVWAAYKYSGDQIVEKGLLWTAIGIGALLAALILERAWIWFRKRQAARAKEPLSKAPIQVHEDDAALAALWDEARVNLAASPEYGVRGRNLNLATLPLFLVVGPTGTGKSSTLLNSGLEPQLLAGQTRADNHVAPTRVANIFISRDALFAEIGGRIWESDLERWTSFLRGFTNAPSGPWWRRLWKDQAQKPHVRGAVLFQDFAAFPEKVDPAKVSRASRHDQERLQAISDVFGFSVPVYAVFAKTDSVTFFEDFFARFPEPECGQPLGAALTDDIKGSVTTDQVTRRFTRAFNTVGSHLAERRALHLSREIDNSRKPGIYEFPREFRRARTAFIQFLSEVFRPNPLKATPFLRGFYFTGIRLVEAAAPAPAASTGWTAQPSSSGVFKADATTIFRPEATEIFRPGMAGSTPGTPNHGGLKPRWMFARQIFEEIVPHDRPHHRLVVPKEDRVDSLRQIIAAVISGIAVLACLIWLQSWWSNHKLIAEAERIARSTEGLSRQPDGQVSLPGLEQLESLRAQAARLDETPPMRMRWGLYAGDSLRPVIRRLYFDRFHALLLGDLNRFIVDKMGRLPEKPAPADPFEPAYSELATHLKISSNSCQTTSAVVASTLRGAARESKAAKDGTHQELVDRQIDYYTASLNEGLPISLTENTGAVSRARRYLSQIKSPERIYRGIREEVTAKLKGTVRLADMVPEYQQVLAGPGEMPEFFSPKGRELFEQELKNPNRRGGTDACILGAERSVSDDPDVERAIRKLYVDDYRAAWKQFLAKFQVLRYANPTDAGRKLDILASQRSPILGVLAFTSNNTYFPGQSQPSDIGSTIAEKAKEILSRKTDPVAKKVEKFRQPGEPKESPAQVTEAFQPVRAVVAPGSEMWVSESNKAYLNALADFRLSLLAIERSTSPTPDPAVHQAALAARDKAFETVRQLALTFEPVGTDGIDAQVRTLLEQPIRNGSGFIVANPDKVAEGKLNAQLAGLCTAMRPVLGKYPFARRPAPDASLEEVASLFAPGTGAMWKYQQESLAEFVVRQENRWARKPDVQKPKIADAVIELLNRSQQISTALYGAGTGQLNLQYSLRTSANNLADQISLEFNFDGKPLVYSKTDVLQKTFHWPPPAGASHTAVASVKGPGFAYPFASGAGIWGVFKVFADAEPRPLNSKIVEWKYNRVAGGQAAPMDPPVRMEFVEFPGGMDLFNPAFFGSLQCPGRAVQ